MDILEIVVGDSIFVLLFFDLEGESFIEFSDEKSFMEVFDFQESSSEFIFSDMELYVLFIKFKEVSLFFSQKILFKEVRLCFGQIDLKRGYILNIDYLFGLGLFFLVN